MNTWNLAIYLSVGVKLWFQENVPIYLVLAFSSPIKDGVYIILFLYGFMSFRTHQHLKVWKRNIIAMIARNI